MTNRNVLLLNVKQHPVDIFLGCATFGSVKGAEVVTQTFGLDRAMLLELAGGRAPL